MTPRTLSVWAACLLVLAGFPVRAGQDFSGANQSSDPCYKIRQMKEFIRQSAEYRAVAGDRDPAYIQCHPLTVTVVWTVNERVDHVLGTDSADLVLTEEFPAYLMLHYGWFDGLQKKELEKFEVLGPEPCAAPCPERARSELNYLFGQMVCCANYPDCRKTKNYNLLGGMFRADPADAAGQSTGLHWRGDSGGLTEGQIRSARLALNRATLPKGCGRFWDPFDYELRLGTADEDYPAQRKMHSSKALSTAELLAGLKSGVLTKDFDFGSVYKEPIPHGSTYTLKGTARVSIAFAPAVEERWRVKVNARELDDTGPPIFYNDPAGGEKELPVRVELGHTLIGEFTVRKVKSDWSYKSGTVVSYDGYTKLIFNGADLFRCDVVPCPGLESEPNYGGSNLDGEVSGQSVKLHWTSPGVRAKACVFCKPLKSYLGKVPYRHTFGSGELFVRLNAEVLPLKSGFTKSGKIQDWLTYTVSLTRIK
jgi:hypothetical protein